MCFVRFTEEELESVSPWGVSLLSEARIQKERLVAVRAQLRRLLVWCCETVAGREVAAAAKLLRISHYLVAF